MPRCLNFTPISCMGPRNSPKDTHVIFQTTLVHWSMLSASWERGSPHLPACGPWCGSTSGPVRPIFISQRSRHSRGAKPREADDARPPRGRPHRPGSRGAERSRRGVPREVPVTQAMTTKARRAPGGSRRAQCPRFLFGAKEASAGEES